MTPSEILSAAAALLEKPGAWTQEELARDGKGQPVRPADPSAVCWCATGAMLKFGPTYSGNFKSAYGALCNVDPYWGLTTWNDAPERTQAEVVAALRTAARREQEAGR